MASHSTQPSAQASLRTEPLTRQLPPPPVLSPSPAGDAADGSRLPGWALVAIGAAIVMAIGVAIGVVARSGSDSAPPPATTVTEAGAPSDDARPGFDSYLGQQAAGRPPSSAPTDSSTVASPYETSPYVPSDAAYSYSAELPAGNAWSEPVESYPTGGGLLRTTVQGPGGAILLIDRTPQEIPQLGGGYESSRVVSHPNFGIATEYVFSTSDLIPECTGAPCVDYLIEDGDGGGWGVLAGGASLPQEKELAGRVARSITDLDY